MPTDYDVVGPSLGQFGGKGIGGTSSLDGLDPTMLSGAGFIPGQEEIRRSREQDVMRDPMQSQRMAQELMQILSRIQTPPNMGLDAGMGTPAPYMSTGADATGDIGGRRRSQAQQFFGGALNNPNNFAAQGPIGSQAFGSQLDSMLGGLGQGPSGIGAGPGIGAGMGAGIGAGFFGGLT